MSIHFEILGAPGNDNALFVRIDSGQAIHRLLFDCGEGCLVGSPFSNIREIDHLFFSHLHMDHVSGFDSFFRCVFDRADRENRIWGPPGTTEIIQHRFQGFLWNLHAEMKGTWKVSNIFPDTVQTSRFELSEAFAQAHVEPVQTRGRFLIEHPAFTVEALTMDHRTPTIAYIVRETARSNLDMKRVEALGLRPGPWMKVLKATGNDTEALLIDGVSYLAGQLRKELLVEQQGSSIAYLTDFILDDAATEKLASALQGCKTVVCEGQYRHSDLELAKKHFHMTTVRSAQLAQRAKVDQLILFHLSDRYDQTVWLEMLAEARVHFPNTSYPAHWKIG